MKDYESWHFRDRSFAWALAISLLWHFFWFFSITITVSPKKLSPRARPRIVSLGPVLDDAIFRALVQNKPQLSQTFYRHLSDYPALEDLKVRTIERHASGDVVSLPFGKRFINSLRGIIGGDKAEPAYEFISRLTSGYSEEVAGLEGEVRSRQLLSRPAEPDFPAGLDPSLRDSETEIRFSVEPSGAVSSTAVAVSSGSPEIDLVWLRYLRKWRFAPLDSRRAAHDQTGRMRFRFFAKTESKQA